MAKRRERIEDIGSLYQIHSAGQQAFKLGFAINTRTRLAILQTGNPDKLALRDEVSCSLEAEKLLHRMLRPLRIAREWYPESVFFDSLMGDFWECLDDKVEDFCDAHPGIGDEAVEAFEAEAYLTEADIRAIVPYALREWVFGCEDEEEPPPEEDDLEKRVLEIMTSMIPVKDRMRIPAPAELAPIGFQGERN